jgi:hypothetical protein
VISNGRVRSPSWRVNLGEPALAVKGMVGEQKLAPSRRTGGFAWVLSTRRLRRFLGVCGRWECARAERR